MSSTHEQVLYAAGLKKVRDLRTAFDDLSGAAEIETERPLLEGSSISGDERAIGTSIQAKHT